MKTLLILIICIQVGNSAFSQVNLQTGSAVFSIPMFNWQDDKSRLSAAVGLDYNSGNGLKVNAIASNVGQGWNLIAGGFISRMVVGEPDDQKPRNTDDLTKYPAGYLYDDVGAKYGCPKALTTYPIYKDKNHLYKQHNVVAADRELDRFAFQFNGKSGIFVLGKNNGDVGVFLGDNTMKVRFERDTTMANVRTTITAFYLTDDNGLVYKFSEHELTKVMKVVYTQPDLSIRQTQPKFEIGEVYNEMVMDDPDIVKPYIISGWYLTEISDPLTNRHITITYPYVRDINVPAGTAFSFYKEKEYSIISHLRSATKTPAIASINLPDGHHVYFNYGKQRIDLKGDYALASVDVVYNNRYISRYELTNSYFILNRCGTPSTIYQSESARLCLTKVKKVSVDLKEEELPYMFEYYLGSSSNDDFVPPPFFHLKDIWGYYNGSNSITYENNNNQSNVSIDPKKPLSKLTHDDVKGLCFVRYGSSSVALNAKSGYAKNGLLKSINYPTGGTLTYEYLQNEGKIENQNSLVGGVHVSKTLVTDGGYSNDCNNPIITWYKYTTDLTNTASSLWGLETPLNWIETESHYEPKDKYFGFVSAFTFGCNYRIKYPGILSREQGHSLTTGQKNLMVLSTVMEAVSTILTIIDVVNLCISATPAAIAAVIIDAIATVATAIISCTADVTSDETTTIYYDTDIHGSNPLPSQFKRVEVSESSGVNGKTVFEFTSSDDYAIWEPTNPVLSMKQRSAYWAYGLLKRSTMYNASGTIVKQIENVYDTSNAKRYFGYHPGLDDRYPSCKCLVVKSTSLKYTDWENPNSYDLTTTYQDETDPKMKVQFYQIYSGRLELKKNYDRVYKAGSSTEYLETVSEFEYDPTNFQLSRSVVTQSNGDKNEKKIKYSANYSSGIFATLNENNIVSLPVSTTVAVKKASMSDYEYLGETVTEFGAVGLGDIKPVRTLQRRFKEPQSGSSFALYYGPGSSSNPNDYVETQSYIYSSSGMLLGVKDEGNRTLSNIYDYDEKYIVASVINADPVLDKPAYSSFETTALGGWILTGTAAVSTSNTITGRQSFILNSSNSLKANLNSAKPYKLSFWATNSNVNVSGSASKIKSGPAINGLTYYEYLVNQGTATVTLTGNGIIDELRVYPDNARMRTLTYDPLVGKTSECDENNRITYYEYDNLARLRFIKDDHSNIVKMYEYNYAKKTAGCTQTFYNKAVNEIFIKDNCGAGYIGSRVPYTIPANKYSSSVSQEEVDRKVEDELNELSQAYANSHGTCSQLFYNVAVSDTFHKEGCDVGYAGSAYIYTVPAGRYSSTISLLKANEMARMDIDANGQALADSIGNASCVISTVPEWIGTGLEQCQSGHRMKQVKDENPNSSTYNQTQYVDAGIDPTCPPQQHIMHIQNSSNATLNLTFTNTSTSEQINGVFSANSGTYINLPAGNYNISATSFDSGQFLISTCTVVYSGYLPANMYSVTISSNCTEITIQNN